MLVYYCNFVPILFALSVFQYSQFYSKNETIEICLKAQEERWINSPLVPFTIV
jgi:hypothetical protein